MPRTKMSKCFTYDMLEVGQAASFSKTITETDVVMFAGISGDLNPAHTDQVQAEQSLFKGRIAHGILVSSLISAVLGMQLPGPGTIYLKQDLEFLKPVYFNDTITATATVKEKLAKGRVVLSTTCNNQAGEIVIQGEALVICPRG